MDLITHSLHRKQILLRVQHHFWFLPFGIAHYPAREFDHFGAVPLIF